MTESKNYGPQWWVWFRTHVLLWEPGVPLSTPSRKKRRSKQEAEEVAAAATSNVDAWVQDAEPAPQAPAPAPPAAGAAAVPGDEPWAVEDEQNFSQALTKVLRGLLIAALVFVCLVGLRQIILPNRAETVVQEVASEAFPAAAGADVAARHATAYLTLDPDDAAVTQREATLALDSTAPHGDDEIEGKQTFTQTAVVRVAQIDPTHARALVTGVITDYTLEGEKWTAGEARPAAVEMLLTADESGTVTVQGEPALVSATPGPVATVPDAGANTDGVATRETRTAAESFFASLGADETVTASVAPGRTITGLGGAAKLDAVTSWTVYDGSADARAAVAEVRWVLPSGVQVTETYTLTLASVSAEEAGGWQIAAVSGGASPN